MPVVSIIEVPVEVNVPVENEVPLIVEFSIFVMFVCIAPPLIVPVTVVFARVIFAAFKLPFISVSPLEWVRLR